MPETRLVSIDASHGDGPDVAQEATHHRSITDADDPDTREFCVAVMDLTDEQRAAIEARDEVRYTESVETHTIQGGPAPDAGTDGGGIEAQENTQQLGYWIEQTNSRRLPAVGSEVHIAVVDSGADSNHPDLVRCLGEGYAACKTSIEGAPWEDDHGHGSHCAGIIAAANNQQGMRGVAPAATVHPIKALDDQGRGTSDDLAEALVHAANMDPKPQVVSCSWGGGGGGRVIHDAIKHCVSKGVLPVFAAGNSSSDVIYPARHPECIAVSATDQTDGFADFSCFGGEVDLTAPGVGIRSTLPGGRYQPWDGTSMATPQVSAVAGLVMGPRSASGLAMGDGEARDQLTTSATDVGLTADQQGAGRLDGQAALVADGGQERPHDLTIRKSSDSTGTCYYMLDVEGSADLGDRTEDPDAVAPGGGVGGGDRLSGKLSAGYRDEFQVSGDVVNANFTGDWSDVTVEVDGERLDPTDLPGFDDETAPMDPTMAERKERAAGRGSPEDVIEVRTSQELADAIEFSGRVSGRNGIAIADGTYRATEADKGYPPDAFQQTFIPQKPYNTFNIVGNWKDPSLVRVASNQAYLNHMDNEHLRIEGLHCNAIQLIGSSEPFVRHCIFEDHQGDDGALGGKPATGRFNDCVIGKEDDRFAATWYGQGHVYFDYDVEIRGGDEAYFKAPNDVTVLIRGSVDFSDPDKPLFSDGRSITPRDLHRGINELPPDPEAPVYQ